MTTGGFGELVYKYEYNSPVGENFWNPKVNEDAHVGWWTYGSKEYISIQDVDERILNTTPMVTQR